MRPEAVEHTFQTNGILLDEEVRVPGQVPHFWPACHWMDRDIQRLTVWTRVAHVRQSDARARLLQDAAEIDIPGACGKWGLPIRTRYRFSAMKSGRAICNSSPSWERTLEFGDGSQQRPGTMGYFFKRHLRRVGAPGCGQCFYVQHFDSANSACGTVGAALCIHQETCGKALALIPAEWGCHSAIGPGQH